MTELLRIEWKGRIGYGDIISPICYAHVMAQKNHCDVELLFHWSEKKGQKYKPEDAESLDYRAEYLASLVSPVPQQVKVVHKFESNFHGSHINYDSGNAPQQGINKFHHFWYSSIQNSWVAIHKAELRSDLKRYIAMNTTATHLQTLEEYGKGPWKNWKDPTGLTRWRAIEKLIRTQLNMEVKHVGYETPIEEAIDIYKNCYLAVGYHGSAIWLARYLRCPMIVCSAVKEPTRKAFPWAMITHELTDDDIPDMIRLRQKSLSKLSGLYEEFKQYLAEPNLHRLRGQRT